MSYYYSIPVVAEAELAEARKMLGTGLVRILGYYEEDGAKSITAIEQALANENAAAMVIPAHTLKGESRQFGANRLAELSEVIEKAARRCLEEHKTPAEVASEVAMLRGCFAETLDLLKASAPQPNPSLLATPHMARATPFASGPRTFGRRNG
ncbi:MAG: Hpt domain-containing protein [Sphingobium sp.]|nr:Hpt domain-containing protein [Sphingobium sp.]